jgi:mannose-1-phosphate guanylyltransferase/mannose-6-phosphate isomerase
MKTIQPILLAGGSGTRLWPLSRGSYPKQFSNILGSTSLFQQSASRLTSSDRVRFSQPITLTNTEFRFIVSDQLQALGIDPGGIIIEPEAKNTASPILAASVYAQTKDPTAILLVAPSDHVIPDKKQLHEAISAGLPKAQSGSIVTFGIKPSHPETGYGYLKLSKLELEKTGVSRVQKFIEKPNSSNAKKMFSSGNFFWNAGIFLFRACDMVKAFELYRPDLVSGVVKAVHDAKVDLGFLRLASEPWSGLESISIDYAIMEKTDDLVSVPLDSKWSDLGDWNAVWSESDKDKDGNVITQNAHILDCTGSLLRSESPSQQLVGIGLKDIFAVAMPDAVLVAPKDRAQDVKKVIDVLDKKNVSQATTFPKCFRPWGWFESLVLGDCFQVKRINIKPKAALSLQSHKYRSEHWILVEGNARVTIDETSKLVNAGESVYVPAGSRHRLVNEGEHQAVLIEVQIGSYLGEDDIIRYEDLYART